MALTIVEKAKAVLIAKLIEQLIGSKPLIHYYENYIEIDFNEEQIKAGKKFLDMQAALSLKSRPANVPPPRLQIKLGKIIVPWAMEKGAPILAGSFGLGYLTKFLTGRRKK